MLLPALTRAKSRAFAATDINNCKQTMLATQIYCTDSNDVMPAPGWQMGYDNWAASGALGSSGLLTAHTANSFQADYDKQVSYFTGSPVGTAPASLAYTPGQLYSILKAQKTLLCPEDIVNQKYYYRWEIITSYCWNGAIVGYPNAPAGSPFVTPFKISRFKPTNILQWENNEYLADATHTGGWNDVANFPLERDPNNILVPSFSPRHGKAAQVGRIDGGAARVQMPDITQMANATAAPNDLWYNPNTITGH
jgi:hypothetical protein